MTKALDSYKKKYNFAPTNIMTFEEYLAKASKDTKYYLNAAERMIKAIGTPKYINTADNLRLRRIFGTRLLPVYETFNDFYGLEEVIHRIVSYFKHAAQDLEESRQILYLMGPVGSSKSSLAERIKHLMSTQPIYVLAVQDEKGEYRLSPVQETPLGLLDAIDADKFNIPAQYLQVKPSPWAIKRAEEFGGDLAKFYVAEVYPNQYKQLAITKTEPGDENCLTGDHEYLTPSGWKRINEYKEGDKIAQYTAEGRIEFVEPSEYITGRSNRIIHFRNRNMSLSVTPSHRMIYTTRGRNNSDILIKYHNAGEGKFSSAYAIQSGVGGGKGLDLSNAELRLQVAIAADGSFRSDNNTKYCVITLQKERKKKRLEALLAELQIEYKTSITRKDHVAYSFYAPERNKNLALYWEASNEQLNIICEEVVYWDGHQKSDDRGAFFTTNKEDADFIQYALIATGKRATISVRKSSNVNHKDLYIVNINKSTTRVNYGEIVQNVEDGNFLVYCFNVPSTMFLTRRNGIVTVTGNNQDISALVGKLDIRKLEFYAQDDPDAYSYSGGLCKGNQGILEFVEMFKAPIKVLHPLLTATQEHNYKGTEAISDIPFNGIVLSHSNESEWDKFKNNKANEAFLDRVYVVEVPYCTRVDEEVQIYKKYIGGSKLYSAPIAPGTLEMLARFSILSRIDDPENSSLYAKLAVYNGDEVRDRYAEAKPVQEYKESASHNEGFSGFSTREAYKVLASVYNFDSEEVAADPVHLFAVLEKTIKDLRLAPEYEEAYVAYIHHIMNEYLKTLGDEIQTAYLDSYEEFGQSMFNRYILYADYWIQDSDFRDPDTNQLIDREELNKELEKLEKPAGIANPKDFRNEVVNFALRYRASNGGKDLSWQADPKMKRIIKASMFSKIEDMLPVISFNAKRDTEEKGRHKAFIDRMIESGYTERQVRRLVEWYIRYKKSN